MKHLPATVAALAALHLPVLAAAPPVVQLDSYATAPSGGEIVAYDNANRLLYVTAGDQGSTGVEIVNAADPANLVQTGVIPVSFPGLNSFSVSSVAADPLGRGFGVATFIPETSGTAPGKVVFFDPVGLTVLHSVDVGWHPDMVRFSADGTKLFVANEGEPVTEGPGQHFDRPGSLSVVDLTGIAAPAQVTGVTAAQVATYDFSAGNLAAGVDLDGLRVHPSNNSAAGRVNDAEAEYVTQAGGKLYVALQENNAVAEFDLAQSKWTRIDSLGTIQQTVDASDRDGGKNIDDTVHGLPMPDGVASVNVGGKTYYLTANEGDGRPADRVDEDNHPNGAADDPRAGSLAGQMDPAYQAALDAQYGGNDALDNSRLGRLRVSAQDSDTNGDGQIDRLTMFGTRSFTVWDADTGLQIYDSGSDFETITGNLVPTLFNSEGTTGSFDGRSPAKGPEPEGITTGQVGGELWAFIGLERVGGWMAYDISDPGNPEFRLYFNGGERAPESLAFLPAWDSPTGYPLLFVGYESPGNRVGVYQIMVPETGARLPLAAGLALGGVVFLTRRRRARR